MPKERFKLVSTSHLFLIKDGKILLIRRFNTGYEDGKYSVIAGHLDGSESATQAMVREAEEEAGIKINPASLNAIRVMNRKSDDGRIDFFFTASSWEGELKNIEPHKCDGMSWFNIDELPENTIPYVRHAIENVRKGIFYSEFGW